MLRRFRQLKGSDDRGFALVLTIILLTLTVFVVTSYGVWVRSLIRQSTQFEDEIAARGAALAGVYRAMGHLIEDRPGGSTATNDGVIFTEVFTKLPDLQTVSINGFYDNGTTDQIALYNYGQQPVDVSGWVVDDDATGPGDLVVPAGTTIQPGEAKWFTSASNVVIGSGSPTTISLYSKADFSALIDRVDYTPTGSGAKWVVLPDGANRNGNTTSVNNNGEDTYYWKQAPFLDVASGAPGASDTNGRGKWMDGHILEKHMGSALVQTYAFPAGQVFVRYGMSFVVRNDSPGWSFGNVGETQLASTVMPQLDHTAANSDSVGFYLWLGNSIVSKTGTFDNSDSMRISRSSTTDPMANMSVVGGVPSPGDPDQTYTISGSAFISEVYDTATNIVSNALTATDHDPSFEGATERWSYTSTNATYGSTTDPAYDGSATFRSTSLTTDYSARTLELNNFITGITAGNDYTLDVPWYGAGAQWADNRLEINIQWFDVSDVLLSTSTADELTLSALNTWEVKSLTATAPASAVKAKILIRWRRTNGTTSGRQQSFDGIKFGAPTLAVVSPDEFIEITLGPDPLAGAAAGTANPQRSLQYIEIFNTNTEIVDLVADQYWIHADIVDLSGAASRRFIYQHPLYGSSNELDTPDMSLRGIGLIVGADAVDTIAIATMSGVNPDLVRWFALGPAGGVATDTFLGKVNTRPLLDTDLLVIGADGDPTQPNFGVNLPGTGQSTDTLSYQKKNASIHDDSTPNYNAGDFVSLNWDTKVPNSSNGPGIFAADQGGRIGYDGANPGMSDTWYLLNFDTFTPIGDAYYRVRVIDEGAKFNVHNDDLVGNPWRQEMLKNFLAADTTQPNPPFPVQFGSSNITTADADAYVTELINNWQPTTSGARLLTNGMINLITTSSKPRWYIPFLTVYGFGEDGDELININTADTGVLYTALTAAIKDSGGISGPEIITLADKIYNFTTGGDDNVANDTLYFNISEIRTKTEWPIGTPLTATEQGALLYAEANRLAEIFTVASNNYFTIYSEGFTFAPNTNVNQITIANQMDYLPTARGRVIAVVRRSTASNRAEIIYWRELLAPGKAVFQIGRTNRYPSRPWDTDWRSGLDN